MYEKELINYLEEFVSERRARLFDEIISKRTRYITVILEDIYQPHNASAVLRTCDCFGIQDVNIIENSNVYDVNPDVALGADKWLSLHKFNKKENNTLDAYQDLRDRGYRIVATSPHQGSEINLNDFDLEKGRAALVFGTEMHGLSRLAIDNADEYLRIPMYGFTESFNISVSAAIIIHHLVTKLHHSSVPWQLTEEEKLKLKLKWLKATIRKSDLLEKKFLKMKTGRG